VEPLKASRFRQEVHGKMDNLQPEWIRKGGSGLITESGLHTTVANDDDSIEAFLKQSLNWQ
jgi:hypothetical protein